MIGDKEHDAERMNWISEAHCFVLFYDLTDRSSFQNLHEIIKLLLQKRCNFTFLILNILSLLPMLFECSPL